jgi:poly(A) polymerase
MEPKRQVATDIVRRLREAGFAAYLVGGCVRDIVMGNDPKDYDIATSAQPAQVVEMFRSSLTVGARFGVVIVPREEGNVEVATFRSDGAYADGRHPIQVEYTKSAEEDVRRRDFTINGLLYDPIEDKVIDYVGGQADIRHQTVRTIGDPFKRFKEDRLRMLRAVRFAARFNFELDPAAADAIRDLAAEIRVVSVERIRDEILKILTEGHARRGFELLDRTTLLEQVLPEVKAMQGVEQPPQFHPEGDVWIHTLMMLDGLQNPGPTLALGVLLHDIGKPRTFAVRERIRFDNHVEVGARMADEICKRLRLSGRDTERVVELVRHHLRFKDFPQMKRSTQIRFLRMDGFSEHLELHRLDCLSSHRNLENYNLAREIIGQIPEEVIKPARLLSGNDLIRHGYKPGPQFKQILQAVEDAQLEGEIHTQEDALHLVRQRFPALHS